MQGEIPVKFNIREFPPILVADKVEKAVGDGSFPLILGGDRSVSIGATAGLTSHYKNLGLIWFGAQPCLLTEDTSSTGNINEMALSAILGRTRWNIPSLGRIRKENVVLIGTRDIQPEEKQWICSEGITCFTMQDIDRKGIQNVMEAALQKAGVGAYGIHLSCSVNCLDPLEAPGGSFPVPGGLFYREAHFAFELMSESGQITSMDVTEVNPLMDDQRRTGRLMSGLIASLLGKRIL